MSTTQEEEKKGNTETQKGEQKNEKEELVEEDKTKQEVKYTSVKDYGVCSDQNWKHRRRMEDAHYIEDGFNGDRTCGFFAVYDGHGGKEAAVFASDNLHKILADELNKEPEVLKNPEKTLEIFRKTFLATDDKLKTAVPTHHGCTAVTCLVAGSGDSKYLYTANVGDARAVLCRDGKAIRLTDEHKASDPVEAKRIIDSGGFIIHGRVSGQIIITRSLGDHLMKEFIIGDPYKTYQKLTDKDTFLIVACDGLWDVVEDQQAVDFVMENSKLSASEISKKLLIKALQDGTTDNLSIVVTKL